MSQMLNLALEKSDNLLNIRQSPVCLLQWSRQGQYADNYERVQFNLDRQKTLLVADKLRIDSEKASAEFIERYHKNKNS